MNPNLIKSITDRLEAVLAEYNRLANQSKYTDLSDLSRQDHQRVITMARAAVTGVSNNSAYSEQLNDVLKRNPVNDGDRVSDTAGVVDALLADVKAGYIKTVAELLHGELFGDFLDMSSHLLDEGYKDASAVIAGSALEAHLRQLCVRHQVPTDANVGGQIKPKKADQMNADLTKANAYTKLDQKNVTAWLDLRNNAAHGKYGAYTADQVRLMVDAVRDFFTRNPA